MTQKAGRLSQRSTWSQYKKNGDKEAQDVKKCSKKQSMFPTLMLVIMSLWDSTSQREEGWAQRPAAEEGAPPGHRGPNYRAEPETTLWKFAVCS